MIYLLHQPIQVVCIMVMQKMKILDGVILGIVSFMITLLVSWLGAVLLFRMGILYRLIAPRDWGTWIIDLKSLFLTGKYSKPPRFI